MSITCVIDTTFSSVDGATELDRVVLILSRQTQQLKRNSESTVKTSETDWDNKQSNRKHQNFNKLKLWLGNTFYTAPRWAPDDPAG